MLELAVIVAYFAVMITIGLVSRRQAKGLDAFFVAGRRGSSLLVAGSLLATIVGGSATVGMAGLGFTRGLTGAWWLLVGSAGLLVLGVFMAKKVRQFAVYTLPGLVEKQYDHRVALAASVLIVIAWVGVIAAQIAAAGKILGVLGIGSPSLWMVAFSAIFITYTMLGGQYAVIRTDTLQAGIIFVGIFAGLVLLLSHIGGWSALRSTLAPEQFAFPVSPEFGGKDLISLLLLVGLTYVVGPDIYSRLFCARDAKTARASTFWVALLIIPFAFGITLIGMGASALFPQIAPELAFPMVIKEVFPPWLGSIVLAALLAAVMSSADTTLLTASTILSVDIVGRLKPGLSQQRILYLSRWGILVLGLGALMVALVVKGVISALLFAYAVYTGGLILPVIAGFYQKWLKPTPLAALVAVVGGGAAALISKIWGIAYLDIGGLLLSGLLLLTVSLISNRMKGRSLDAGQTFQ